MRRKELEERYRATGADEAAVNSAVEAVEAFETFVSRSGGDVAHVPVDAVREYLDLLIREGRNSQEEILALVRYGHVTKQWDLVIHLLSVFGPRGVIDSIAERVDLLAGEEKRERIFAGLREPPFGSPPEAYPGVTKELLSRMKSALPDELWKKALAGNHHRIPLEAFAEDRRRFLELGDIRAYLRDKHERSVAVLEKHARDGSLWFEQRITPRVVEFVRANLEILSGVLEGDRIYVTKIPYDPDRYLTETDPLMKRYHACHCSLARASILRDGPDVSMDLCHCSAGYTKVRFDVAFDKEHEVDVLESVLGGSDRCRFAIMLTESYAGMGSRRI